jgi:hypothetical protein
VVVSTCGEGDCAYRLGAEWIGQRLSGRREPRLRRSVPRDRVCLVAAGQKEQGRVGSALAALRSRLEAPARSALEGEPA